MSRTDDVRKAMVEAMKAKDKETKDTLSMLLAALKNKAIDKRADLTEEEEVQVVLKEIKQTKESLEMTPADRTELIEEFKSRIAVLEQFAPKMMDADVIKTCLMVGYGNTCTNMCQPFWAIALLGITGLKAKDIMGYSTAIMLCGGLIFVIASFLPI